MNIRAWVEDVLVRLKETLGQQPDIPDYEGDETKHPEDDHGD